MHLRQAGQGMWDFEIFFEPLRLSEGTEAQLIFDGAVRAESVPLDCDADGLSGTRHIFPLNPAPGYIDASVYFTDTHNPVDISELAFTTSGQGELLATVTSRWVMEYEATGFSDFDYRFTLPVLT